MPSRNGSQITKISLRVLGAGLLVLSLFPVYRGLDTSGDAFRVASVDIAETTLELAWWGTVLVVLLAVVLMYFLGDRAVRMGEAFGRALVRPSRVVFAGLVAVVATVLAWSAAAFLFDGMFTNMDEIASAIQARYMANGSLAGPDFQYPEAWLVTNTLMVEDGWVSQYPPSHLVLMAAFFLGGTPTLFGPFLMGIMVFLLALSFPRLLPEGGHWEGTARAAAILVAVSPFLLFLGGGALSHLSAGAAAAAILYAALKARDGSAWWGVGVGVAVGIMVCSRPLIGLVLGTALPLSIWASQLVRDRGRWFAARSVATILGGAPFAVLLGLYNKALFGSATTLGYLAAFGKNHQLGFHVDPWGNIYDPEAALAFTSTDLLALGVQFLETPLPLTVVVACLLLFRPILRKGGRTILLWAFLPVAANALYWFHSSRMMFEAAPAWILFATVGIVDVVSSSRGAAGAKQRLGEWLSWVAVVSLLMAVGWGVPTRWRTYSWTEETRDRIQVPDVPTEGPSIVFVHASWNERLSSRLQGAGGMRQDSIVSILRRNTNCALQQYANAREERARGGNPLAPLPEVDLLQSALYPEGLLKVNPYPEMTIRTIEGEVLSPECMREIQADRFGNVALAPLLWQGDLPGLEEGGILFVRDLGPDRNRRIVDLFPDRRPFVFAPFGPSSPPEVVPYEDAMRVLWGEET